MNHAAPDTAVYVVDDDQSMREALEDLLASVGLYVCSFESTQAFLDAERPDVPGCLVLDIRMPGQSGLEFQKHMKGLGIHLPVIFITGHGDIPMSVAAMKNGAVDFLPKPFRDQDLLDAIQQGIERDREQRQKDSLLSDCKARWATLTSGEKDVFDQVTQGRLNKQIAIDLNLSEITIKVRRAQVMRKLQAKSVAELVRVADMLRSDLDL